MENLSRRERQIMEILYAQEKATVAEVFELLDDPPGMNSVRSFLQILEDKGHVIRKKKGRSFVYSPKGNRKRAGLSALHNVLKTFYGGSIDKAVSAHFTGSSKDLDDGQIDRLQKMIDEAKASKKKRGKK